MSGGRAQVDASFIVAFDGESHALLRDGVLVYEGDTIVHVGRSYQGLMDELIGVDGEEEFTVYLAPVD
ncbi:MAG TPA: hypothetical protein VM050_07815 [Patescibacteria group bacterium]|nr:hypothetical protein [Patescibacteria group bacterium]